MMFGMASLVILSKSMAKFLQASSNEESRKERREKYMFKSFFAGYF